MSRKCERCKEGAALPFSIRTAFQPIVDVQTGRPFAYEALVRGESGQDAGWVLGQVTPDLLYTFDQACRVSAIVEAVAAGLLESDARLSINFMPNAVYAPEACIRKTLEAAAETGLPCDRLIFEFTESERLDTDHVRSIVKSYRRMGFSTAIDDFGAGFSGLNLLADIQTDFVKLDMALIRGIDTSPPRRMIVAANARLCEEMGITVIAEGVESEQELQVLKDIGIRYIQGHLLARPELGKLPQVFEGKREIRAA